VAEETEALGETSTKAASSTTNPTFPRLCSTPGGRSGKLATNLLSYGMSQVLVLGRDEVFFEWLLSSGIPFKVWHLIIYETNSSCSNCTYYKITFLNKSVMHGCKASNCLQMAS
jgi:hypothetical protein